jgi:molybdopterin-guanine dinucleotide biosynthesis protein A
MKPVIAPAELPAAVFIASAAESAALLRLLHKALRQYSDAYLAAKQQREIAEFSDISRAAYLLLVEKDGSPTRTGIRGHRCVNHEAVRFYCQRIIEKMTQHYAGNPAVVAWQIDNELEAYFCFCETCNARFREWLKSKYGTLEALNQAYGNVVWSGEYSSWEQIQPP